MVETVLMVAVALEENGVVGVPSERAALAGVGAVVEIVGTLGRSTVGTAERLQNYCSKMSIYII